MPTVVGVQFKPVTKIYYFDPAGHNDLKPGDWVVVDTTNRRAVAQVVQSNERFIELTARGVSKGAALRALARRLGIRHEEIVAIGDQDNDRSLLEAAGLRVAMGNAVPELKALADLIAPSVSEDGVAWAIREAFRPVVDTV